MIRLGFALIVSACCSLLIRNKSGKMGKKFWVLDDEGVDTGGTSSNESNSPIK